MIEQCLPTTPSLEQDWVLWVELWLRAARHPELRPVAEELYARLHAWFRDEIAAGVDDGEFAPCDADEITDRTPRAARRVRHQDADRRRGDPARTSAATRCRVRSHGIWSPPAPGGDADCRASGLSGGRAGA